MFIDIFMNMFESRVATKDLVDAGVPRSPA